MPARNEAACELVGAGASDVRARREELMQVEDPHGTGGNASDSPAGNATGEARRVSSEEQTVPAVPTLPHGVLRRALDVLLACLGLALAAPLLAVAAIAIKLDSAGPVLYRQRRVGYGGRPFELFKLRTMVVGAERIGAGIYVTADDPRITRVGRVLRRWSLDELPNLINVLRGEMAIVGPRPTVAQQVVRYSDRQRRRLAVKPGITGWAQIHGRTELPWPERIELDLWYVENRSLWLDLRIIARTVWLIVSGHGLYSSDPQQGFAADQGDRAGASVPPPIPGTTDSSAISERPHARPGARADT